MQSALLFPPKTDFPIREKGTITSCITEFIVPFPSDSLITFFHK